MAAATRNTNTDRNDAAFIAARDALAAKLLAKREARAPVAGAGFAQAAANALARSGNGVGTIIGAAPAAKDNFAIAYASQRELQAAKSAAYALEMAEKVLKA